MSVYRGGDLLDTLYDKYDGSLNSNEHEMRTVLGNNLDGMSTTIRSADVKYEINSVPHIGKDNFDSCDVRGSFLRERRNKIKNNVLISRKDMNNSGVRKSKGEKHPAHILRRVLVGGEDITAIEQSLLKSRTLGSSWTRGKRNCPSCECSIHIALSKCACGHLFRKKQAKEKGQGKRGKKSCPNCEVVNACASRFCKQCKYDFRMKEMPRTHNSVVKMEGRGTSANLAEKMSIDPDPDYSSDSS